MDEVPETASELLPVERLKEIRKQCKDSQFGYANVNNQLYFRDVSLLLADRELWVAANRELGTALARLKKDNADLGLRLDEALRAREPYEETTIPPSQRLGDA